MNASRGKVIGFSDEGYPMVKYAACGLEVRQQQMGNPAISKQPSCDSPLSQLRLRLGWSISIHKSQGMSIDCLEVFRDKCLAGGTMPPAAHQPAGDSLWLMMALSTCSLSDATPPDSPLPCNLRLYRFWEQEGSCLCWSVCGKRYFKCFSRWLQARTLAGLLCGDAICAPDTYIHDCVLFHSLLHQLECLKEDCAMSVQAVRC